MKFKKYLNNILKKICTYKVTADRISSWAFYILLVLFFSIALNTNLSLLEYWLGLLFTFGLIWLFQPGTRINKKILSLFNRHNNHPDN